MPYYLKQGQIPPKRHTVFKKSDGSLYYEELISREGFSGIYTNCYHLQMPTRVLQMGDFREMTPKIAKYPHGNRHFMTFRLQEEGDMVTGRKVLLVNQDVSISKVHAREGMDYFYRNGHHDELVFIQSGTGLLKTNLGDLKFGAGDYIVVPRGVICQYIPEGSVHALITESAAPVETPNRYRNSFGQLLEHSPFCERDIRTPELAGPVDETGEYSVHVRLSGGMQEMVVDRHPFDVVGWDGCYYPWIFNINDFEPIVGSIHQPPPVHQTFQSAGFVVCSFVRRPFDFHKDAIPAPYPHSNLDSDEVLFYSKGNFMSRKGISEESMTLHPMGLPHGPQPGKYEDSIGVCETDELAVMIDTFKPLHLTETAMEINDEEYYKSWIS